MDPEVIAALEPVVLVWLAFLGACVGSFLNVCIFRLPRRCLSVFAPARSFCPRCGRKLTALENVPIASFVALRGRCRGCALPISWRYPLVEAITMALFGYLAWRHLGGGRIVEPEAWAVFGVHAALGAALIVCTGTDIDHRIIPDEIDVTGLILAPLVVAALPAAFASAAPDLTAGATWLARHLDSPFAWWGIEGTLGPLRSLTGLETRAPDLYPHAAALSGSLLGAVSGAGFIFLTGALFTRYLGLEAMGFGDVKYMAMIGGFAGWQGVVTTFMVAFCAGSLGGVVYMAWSGRPEVRGRDLTDESLTPLRRLALRLTGARGPAAPDEVLPIRRGTGLLARFATGDPYIPFGPFLTAGAAVAILWPEAFWRAVGALAPPM